MEEIKKGGCPEGCVCFMCQQRPMGKSGCCGNYILVRIILTLLIFAFVFFAGVWFGKMSSLFRQGGHGDQYGYSRFMQNRSSVYSEDGRCGGIDRFVVPTQESTLNTTSSSGE